MTALWLYAASLDLSQGRTARCARGIRGMDIQPIYGFPPLKGGLPTGGKIGFFPAMLSPHSWMLHKGEREI